MWLYARRPHSTRINHRKPGEKRDQSHVHVTSAGPLFTPTPSPHASTRGMSPSMLVRADDLDASPRPDEPRPDPAHDADDEGAADRGPEAHDAKARQHERDQAEHGGVDDQQEQP